MKITSALVTSNQCLFRTIECQALTLCTWTNLSNILMKEMTEADQGFNAVYMMLDSGARGSKDQIKQL